MNIELKAKLLDVQNLTCTNQRQSKEIIVLNSRITELEAEMSKYLLKIGHLRDQNDCKDSEMCNALSQSDSVIQKLSAELNSLKCDCACLLEREREFLNCRQSVAVKLGHDISMASRQDFDMLARINCFVSSIQKCHIDLHRLSPYKFPCTQIESCTYCCR